MSQSRSWCGSALACVLCRPALMVHAALTSVGIWSHGDSCKVGQFTPGVTWSHFPTLYVHRRQFPVKLNHLRCLTKCWRAIIIIIIIIMWRQRPPEWRSGRCFRVEQEQDGPPPNLGVSSVWRRAAHLWSGRRVWQWREKNLSDHSGRPSRHSRGNFFIVLRTVRGSYLFTCERLVDEWRKLEYRTEAPAGSQAESWQTAGTALHVLAPLQHRELCVVFTDLPDGLTVFDWEAESTWNVCVHVCVNTKSPNKYSSSNIKGILVFLRFSHLLSVRLTCSVIGGEVKQVNFCFLCVTSVRLSRPSCRLPDVFEASE